MSNFIDKDEALKAICQVVNNLPTTELDVITVEYDPNEVLKKYSAIIDVLETIREEIHNLPVGELNSHYRRGEAWMKLSCESIINRWIGALKNG